MDADNVRQLRPRPSSRPRRGRPRAVPEMRALGTTGLKISGGYVFDEPARELVGAQGARIYREMRDDDPIISAVLYAIEMLVRQVKWGFTPRPDDQSDQGQADADFVRSCWDDLDVSHHDLLAEILTMLPFGWAAMETVYKQRRGEVDDPTGRSRFNDGRIGWRTIALRGQDTLLRWDWDLDAGFVRGFWQMDAWSGRQAYLPIERFLLFRTSAVRQNPEGRSMLRGAFRPWYYKKHIQAIEAIGIERDMAGLPYAGVPPEYFSQAASPDQKAILAAFVDIVTGIRNDDQAGVVYPLAYDEKGNKLFELGLLSTGGARQFRIDETVNRYNRDIALFALADFLMLGHEQQGSFALAEDKTSMFTIALTAILDAICDVFTRFAIPRLLRLNGRSTEQSPVMIHGDVEDVSLDVLGTYVQKIALAGVPILEGDNAGPVTRALLERAKLPAPDPGAIEEIRSPARVQDESADHQADVADQQVAIAKTGARAAVIAAKRPPVPGRPGGINQSGRTGTGGARQTGQRPPAADQSGTSGGPGTTNRTGGRRSASDEETA